MDQSKKTMRHFYCRDVMWETFEQMANDFDCSIDYLINEAMRTYARAKNYPAAASSSQQVPAQVVQQALGNGSAAPAASARPPSMPSAGRAAGGLASTTMPPPPPPPPVPGAGLRPITSPPSARPGAARASIAPTAPAP